MHSFFFFFFFVSIITYFLVGLGFELRTWCLQNRHSTARATPPAHFALLILEMGSQELFAWAGLKPQSSRPPK
jgi:hypothetical protein